MTKKRKTRSIFRIVLSAHIYVLITEIILLFLSLSLSGVGEQLRINACDILSKQAENRKGYLETTMIQGWSNLTELTAEINLDAQKLIDDGLIDLETIDSSSDACEPFLLAASSHLIDTLRSNEVTGVFVVLNTHDLDREKGSYERPGLYIRDLDPVSTPSTLNGDLLLEKAPIQTAKYLEIPMDSSWQPLFTFEDSDQSKMLYYPFQRAYSDGADAEEWEDYGYWMTDTYRLNGSYRSCISYSVPLILDDGTVYGIAGVEILTDHVMSLLPYSELHSDSQGAYFLGTVSAQDLNGESQEIEFFPVIRSSGASFPTGGSSGELILHRRKGGYHVYSDGKDFYAAVHPLYLYSRNAPFSNDQWVLVASMDSNWLFAFSNHVARILTVAALLTALVGFTGSILATRRLSKPISSLSDEVALQKGKIKMPSFSTTGIREIDQFSAAITELSHEVLETSTKFLRIMDMASVELGGYELKKDSDSVYVTDNFFHLLGMGDVNPEKLSASRFRQLLDLADQKYKHSLDQNGHKVYRIPLSEGAAKYLRIEMTDDGQCEVGLAEDVTASTLERIRIEHERDYDSLTGLISRRAFYRRVDELFSQPDTLRHAALVMMDLDNLKSINDTFGHDWGDQYIRQAGQCLLEYSPKGTVCARVSGDEFFLLFYGYESNEEIRRNLAHLTEAVRRSTLRLPSGRELKISASGGVAWYPDDSSDFNMLMKYADFAMYQIKRSHKGELQDFDLGAYNNMAYMIQVKQEFHELITKELLTYHFQPIVSATTGRVMAYEALMRVDMPTLHTPDAVLRVAKEEGCLHEIEHLTLFKASEAFDRLLNEKVISQDARLFINSIASEHLTQDEVDSYMSHYLHIQHRLVIEITESEHLDSDATAIKKKTPGFSGMFALDDYGSGYNTEINLLALKPHFIKVDMTIIRDIDKDPNKQEILKNISAYAHQRGMYIVAEGLETAAETVKSIELGADYLQGYFLARPAAVPNTVNPDARSLIASLRLQQDD